MIPSIIALPIVIGCMLLLYSSVLRQEQSNDRFRVSRNTRADRAYSRQVAYQGILYVWAFLAVEVPWITAISLWSQNKDPDRMWVSTAIFLPLQGFWNALVYLRPHYWHYVQRALCRKEPGMDGSSKRVSTARGSTTDTMDIPSGHVVRPHDDNVSAFLAISQPDQRDATATSATLAEEVGQQVNS